MFGFFGKPSRSKFARLIMDAARKAGVTGEFTCDEEEFVLRQDALQIFLGNAYDDYCRAKRRDRARVVENTVSLMLKRDVEYSREDALDQCVAVIRERATVTFIDLMKASGKITALPIPYEPATEWYVRTVVLDAPGSMRYINEKDLEEWGLSFDELYEAGLERLRNGSLPQFRDEDGYFVGTWNDDYDSSRVLLPELFQSLPIEGQPVFCIPNRLNLLVADSKNPKAILAMIAKAEEIFQSEPRRQNPSVLTYQNGELADFSPPLNSALFQAVQRTKGISGLSYYDEQKGLLEELHEKTGKDIYVGKFTLRELESGEYRSYSVWSKGIPTLLAKTDVVMFFDPDLNETVAAVKWSDVEAVAGDLLLDAEMFPPRFYVSKFPTEQQFAAMPKQAL